MNARRVIETVALAVLAALLLYAGWRGTWMPAGIALGVLALRWLWRHAPLALLVLFWPDADR